MGEKYNPTFRRCCVATRRGGGYLISLNGGLLLLLLLPYGVVLLFIFLQFLLADLLSSKITKANEEGKYNYSSSLSFG